MLNAKQQENYNYQKASAILADYGYNTIRLSDDWKGADFLAAHVNGNDFLKVQLKGCLIFEKKYRDKNIWICFPDGLSWFLYRHDELLEEFGKTMNFINTPEWNVRGKYHWRHPTTYQMSVLEKYKL